MTRVVDPKTDENELAGGFLRVAHGGTTRRNITVRVDADRLPEAEAVELPKGHGKGRKTKLAAFGLNPTIIREGDPAYAAAIKQANKYRKIRMKELQQLHGHVSAGAGALLASASLALAASRFLYERYANDMENGGGDTSTLKQASSLADSARAAELAAWELSAREGVLKRRQEASLTGMPWLTQERSGAGRKSNLERQATAQLEDGVVTLSDDNGG